MLQPLPTALSQDHLCDLDQQKFIDDFNRRPFKIGHQLSDHPLFALESLIALSKDLPADRVEYNAGNLPVSQDPTSTPQNGLSVEETIQRIQQCQSWLVLKNVELNNQYGDLLDQCLDQVKPLAALVSEGMTHKQGFIFISSPGSVTPFHIDPENNFLLQIRGTKKVWMFGQNDREVLPETQVEDFFSGAHRNMQFEERFRERGEQFDLSPGEGLHFPVVAPHYVENGPEVSVSFSITFQTQDSSDRQTLHRFNRHLRRIGLTPSNVGERPGRDNAKLAMLRTLRKVKNIVRRPADA